MTAPIPTPLVTSDPLIAAARKVLREHPAIFLSRGRLVEVVPDNPPRVLPVKRSRIQGLLERDETFWTNLMDSDHAPAWLISHLLDGSTWPKLAKLSGITDVPMLRPDGSLITR